MTVLSACQGAAIELNEPQPSSVFSSDGQFARELALQANRAAVAIAKAHDWQNITALQTMTGDGSTTSFPLPDDYDRMPVKANVLTSQFASGLRKARDLDEWLDFQLRPFIGTPGSWIVLNGAMQVLPAIGSGVVAKFYYIKKTIVSASDGMAKTSFTDDADKFNLSERLLALGIVWRWKSMKKMEYAEDMRNFEIALSEEVSTDKGSRVLTVGRQRLPAEAELAYPTVIV